MKIIYLSFTGTAYSVNATYITGLRQNGVEVVDFYPKSRKVAKYREILKFFRSFEKGADFIFIGDDCPQLVILMKVFTRKPIVYNALCSVYERMIVSRNLASRISIKALYYWFLDFFAGHLADVVMLESNHQVEYFKKLFRVKTEKCFIAWTGVLNGRFFFDPQIQKASQFTVVFRGRLLPEAGAEVLVRAAKILDDKGVMVTMHAFGIGLAKIESLISKMRPKCLRLMAEFLPQEKVRQLMQEAHLSIGQLSDHPRLLRTIPHKAYESLAQKVPYLTARNAGVRELLKEGETCLACRPGDAKDLAEKILWAKGHPVEIARIANNAYELYQSHLTEKHLASRLLERLRSINSRFV